MRQRAAQGGSGHVLPVQCCQSLSWTLSTSWRLLLEGQAPAAEPAGSPGTLHRPAPPPCPELSRLSAARVTFRATEASGSRPGGPGGPAVPGSGLQALGTCHPPSLASRQELCSSSASKASAQRDPAQDCSHGLPSLPGHPPKASQRLTPGTGQGLKGLRGPEHAPQSHVPNMGQATAPHSPPEHGDRWQQGPASLAHRLRLMKKHPPALKLNPARALARES